ncbi:MAG: hypothetical protein PVH29_14120 [Candidatus Zixiibacteriota bacterium]
MKRTVLIVLSVMACTASWAYLGEVVSSYASPAGVQTRGLAISASYLFVVDGTNPGIVYRVVTETGSLRNWYQVGWSGSNSGLAWTPSSNLWVGCPSNNRVYRCAAPNGSIHYSWNAGHDPYGCAPLCSGDNGAGTSYLYTTDSAPSGLFNHQLNTGSIVRSITIPNSSDYDCAYDWRNRLVWLGDSPNVIYGYTNAASVAGSFIAPANQPRGLAYSASYLYVGCASNGYIYKVHCPEGFVGVEPASLGDVRALFR